MSASAAIEGAHRAHAPQAQGQGPVFHIEATGRLANQMIQYMVALKFASLVPGCRISNVNLPDWDIALPGIDGEDPPFTWTDPHRFDMEALARRMNAGEIRRLEYAGYGQRMENFLDRAQYQGVFRSPQHHGVGFGPDHLLCHVRSGDVLAAIHPGYVLTPVAFYEEIVARTGLVPVFMGETSPSLYMNRLREALPQAVVLPQGDIIRDFETIRQSKNILVSCSTFCWLAAWLSDADRIFMPVNGILNPRQDHRIDLLPLDDPRYRFYLFPVNYAVDDAVHVDRHSAMTGMWREMPHGDLQNLLFRAPRVPRRIDAFVELFDEPFYLGRYPAVREDLAEGRFATALDHYREHGFADGSQGFDFDEAWYTSEYPMAAFEVSHGDYDDAIHHYVEIGRARGYRPVPPVLWSWKWRLQVAAAKMARI